MRKSLLLRVAMRERDATAAEAEAVARHDVLTGLANRRLFLETLERRRAAAGDDPSQAVLLIDLDRFKPVNDIYGHAAGNAVLCAVAERLSALMPPSGLAARLGGDEFALLVPLDGGSDGLSRLAQALIASIAAPIQWQGNELKVGATIGIAPISADQADADAVLHAADLAMYQGKKDGRGMFRVFKSAMDVELKARAQLESDLRHAIQIGEIEPFYQPVVTLPEKTLIGVEVLARWRHPTRGLLGPDHFIAIAEETGLIARPEHEAAAPGLPRRPRLAGPLPAGDEHRAAAVPGPLAVPSASSRSSPRRASPPSRLEVEITETALVQDLEAARATLTSLQNLGVRIALDDFGTGYSSLYHLRELKFDKLKIDRTYVDTITMSDERAKLVDAIIKLGAEPRAGDHRRRHRNRCQRRLALRPGLRFRPGLPVRRADAEGCDHRPDRRPGRDDPGRGDRTAGGLTRGLSGAAAPSFRRPGRGNADAGASHPPNTEVSTSPLRLIATSQALSGVRVMRSTSLVLVTG